MNVDINDFIPTFEEEIERAPVISTATDIKRTATGIQATVTFIGDPDGTEPYGYHFSPSDCVARGVRGYRDLDAGKFGEVAPYTAAMKAEDARMNRELQRGMLLREANDVCQPLAEEKDLGIITDDDLVRYKRWALYRQALRKLDVTTEVEWPERPE